MIAIAIAAYAAALILANLSVSYFGVVVAPINAFVFIGLDLVLRDWLHARVSRWQMLALILGTGCVTYWLNPAAGVIAIASVSAFVLAAIADWAVFSTLKGSWLFRSNGSNIVGAAVDSLIFPTIAFGGLLPAVVAAQFAAKVAGGAVWAWLLRRHVAA